jgi:hypothetical protein
MPKRSGMVIYTARMTVLCPNVFRINTGTEGVSMYLLIENE